MNTTRSIYKRHRFPPEIIQYAVIMPPRMTLVARRINTVS
jgi:hypothetical protein